MVIRRARPADHAAYTRLFAELGVPDPVPGAETFATSIVPQMWIAERDGDVIGYITWRAYGATAHVVQLAVDPARRGERVGQALLEHVRAEARAAGCVRWYLNVKRDNAPALALYGRLGLALELESVAMAIPWARVPHTTMRQRLASEADDAAIAARFAMPVERLAAFRARAGYRLVTLRDDDDGIIGFAAFDPAYPGAATFCATDPAHAATLLDALRAHADPRFDFVRVAIEGDRPLAAAVLALGAEVTFEILRLGSPL